MNPYQRGARAQADREARWRAEQEPIAEKNRQAAREADARRSAITKRLAERADRVVALLSRYRAELQADGFYLRCNKEPYLSDDPCTYVQVKANSDFGGHALTYAEIKVTLSSFKVFLYSFSKKKGRFHGWEFDRAERPNSEFQTPEETVDHVLEHLGSLSATSRDYHARGLTALLEYGFRPFVRYE